MFWERSEHCVITHMGREFHVSEATASASPLVERNDDGTIVTLRLHRPGIYNAINRPTLERLHALLTELSEEANRPRVLILSSTAPGFCSGIDLKESREANQVFAGERVRLMHETLGLLRRFPAPVICAIDGVATGLGCELAISGDLRLATPASRFCYPELKVAVPSPAHHLTWLIGLSRAQDMLLTARWVDAREAAQIGLITRIVDDADVAAQELAQQLMVLSPLSLRDTKSNIYVAIDEGAAAGSEHHIAGVTSAAGTEDRMEALRAFAEKRPANFKGR